MTLRLTFLSLLTAGALAATLAAGASAASAPLVLQKAHVPGLASAPAGADAARAALAAALRPALLPALPAKSVQASHFRNRGVELWSIAFVLPSLKAAQGALAGMVAAARRARLSRIRVGIGETGWLFRRAPSATTAAVLFRRGPAIGAVVFGGPLAPGAVVSQAVAFARLADQQLLDTVAATAWDRALQEVLPNGKLTKQGALDVFAVAYGPLPGAKRPEGLPGPAEGTLAAQALLAHWRELTAPQQRAALRALGMTRLNRYVSARRPSAAAGREDFGDPTFVRSPQFQTIVNGYIEAYEERLGLKFMIPTVVGTTGKVDGSTVADALVLDRLGTPIGPKSCRIRVFASLQARSFKYQLASLAHEAFHCIQNQMAGFPSFGLGFPLWIQEGTAEWAALTVSGVSWDDLGDGEWVANYLRSCDRPLFERTYDAVGFFGHSAEVAPGFWAVLPGMFRNTANLNTYSLAGADSPAFLDSWGSSVAIKPSFGLSWTTRSPLIPPMGKNCNYIPLLAGPVFSMPVSARAFALSVYVFDAAAAPPKRPLMHVQIKGKARLGDGRLDTTALGDAYFCTKGKCECPEGEEGNPPPAPPLASPAHLALTGARNGAQGQVTLESLDQYCKKKEKKPPAPRKAPPITTPAGGGGGGSPASSGCASGCGGSNGDPHLTTFDGRFYDFQGAGEFTLLRSSDGSLEVQVREEPYPGSTTLAINTAVALRVGKSRIVVSRGEPLVVRINGLGFVARARPFPLPGGGTIAMAGGELQVTWPDLTVARLWSVSSWGVAVLVKPVDARKGQLAGLLGDFDGSQDNDFKTRSGKALDVSKIASSREQLYGVFGESWRVTPQSSLFDYAPGQSTRTFTDRGFPKEVVTVTSLSPQQRRAAEAVCRGLGITDRRIFEACVLDVAGTGDSTFATAGAQLQRTGVSFGSGAPGGGGGAAGGDKRWTPIATGGSSNSIGLTVAVDGGKVVVAYTLGPSAESATFTPSLSQDIVGGRRDTLTSGWDLVSDPILLPRSGGGLQALFAGLSASGNPPSGAYLAPRNPDGSFGSAARALTEPAVGGAAVLAPDGQPLWAAARLGLTISRGSSTASQVQVPEAGGTPYIPSIGRDGMGRYWLVWYALGSPNGLRMVQIDPANGRRLSAPMVVPGSAGVENSSIRLALACAQTCRLVYLSSQRVVSWAPGESAPTVVAQGSDPGSFLAAVYLPNGRLWAAWYDRRQQTYRAVSGDAAGRGGSPVSIGRPPGGVGGFAIAAAAVGDNVVVVSNWQVGGSAFGRFVNVVRP